ncbi:MAG: helix-turn-helix transcriptional regulator [Clostridia bacterium]|nr:helix-turn-helix transcriptional regulator [Clostridia bacterium]
MKYNSIGKFIAALRKSHNMTQKELGDKLFVSDKTVSRWERDECTPDLHLIPVIADIFGVTSDELLRGERNPAPFVLPNSTQNPPDLKTNKPTQKQNSEKQLKRLFKLRLVKYKNQSFISAGLGLLGVIVAVICNFAFYRGLLGACLSLAFFLAGVICQICFTNSAFYRQTEETDEDENDQKNTTVKTIVSDFNRNVAGICKNTLLFLILINTLPIPFLFIHTAYAGLTFSSWLLLATISFAVVSILLFAVYKIWIEKILVSRGLITLTDQQKKANKNRKRILLRVGIPCISVFAVLAITYLICIECLNVYNFTKAKTFDNYDDFKAYMAQDVLYGSSWEDANGNTNTEIFEEIVLPDEKNEEKPSGEEQEERKYYLFNKHGEEICEYVWNNQEVATVHTAQTGDGLPIKVYTKPALSDGWNVIETLEGCLLLAMTLDCAIFVLLYFIKMKKVR